MDLTAYDSLVTSGAIGSLKRDVVLEASDDIYYLAHIRRWFEEASRESAEVATACTVRAVRELVVAGFCSLATWGQPKGTIEAVEMSDAELTILVDRYQSPTTMPFDFFLSATEKGNHWATRYRQLVAEL